MHGPAPAHPPYPAPARGTVVLLRVLFVAATVLSIGFLAWAALLRAALVQRRPLGWWLFGADLVLLVGIVASGTYAATDWRSDVQVGAMLVQMAGAVAYYLVVDIRAAREAGPGLPHGGGYGYPPAAYPAGPAAHPGAPTAPAYAPQPYAHPHTQPQPTPAPVYTQETQPSAGPYGPAQGAAYPPGSPQERPQRIDRVRAELDELSDYLRKEEGR